MPQTEGSAARKAMPRLVAALAEDIERHRWPVKFSVGVVTCEVAPPDVDSLIRLGDELMYAAKRAGKDRIEYGRYPAAAGEHAAEAGTRVLSEPQ